jgi:capsid portal protein
VEQLYCYESYSVGQDVYSLPSYSSAMNWIFLDGDMSNLHKSNIQNSIFPSFMMMFPKKFQNDEEKREVKKSLEQAKGSNEAGKIIVLSGNQKESLPDLVPIPTNQNDKLFIETDEQINLKICQAHTIDPMLMGVRVSGKLGGGSDIKQAYIIFEKNTIMPLREEVQEIFNDLLIFQGMTPSFVLNDFQIINETIVEK